MLLPINRFIEAPIISLQMEAAIGRAGEPIIDPRQLTVVGFYAHDVGGDDQLLVLHTADIREVSHLGLIVDDSEVIMPLDDLVRLQEIIDFDFNLIGTPVVDELGRKYGKVEDYSLDPKSFYIQQLYTHQSILRSLSSASNLIHRHQIVSVTNDQIVVSAPTIRDEVVERAGLPFTNPFRSSGQPE